MGLFDSIKAIKNAVTGGAAKVSVEIPAAKLTEAFQVKVRAVPQNCSVKYNRVYLLIEGVESVDIPDYEVKPAGAQQSHREQVRKSAETLRLELNVAGAGELQADQTGEWSTDVKLPAGAIPEFRGKLSSHGYRAFAGLDCTGNDPDSGWVPFRVA
jgi:hypothetical protein